MAGTSGKAGSRRALVPGRIQSLAEVLYGFVADLVRQNAGKEGMKFFPFVFSLFMFVLVANLFGMIPVFFTVTSHIIVTFALALLVFVVVVVYGFWRNGPKFLKLFVPSGAPLTLDHVAECGTKTFLERREMGIVNVGEGEARGRGGCQRRLTRSPHGWRRRWGRWSAHRLRWRHSRRPWPRATWPPAR